MRRKFILFFTVLGAVSISGCIKDTFNMDLFSKRAHISPFLAIAAIKGDISFSDIVESSDTVVFGEDNFVSLIFKRNAVINLKPEDFSPVKGLYRKSNTGQAYPYNNLLLPVFDDNNATIGQMIATIDPDTIDLGIEDVLNHISGEILVSDPSIKLSYKNAFVDPMMIDFEASGRRHSDIIGLDLAPFELNHPADTLQVPVLASFIIDKGNSSLPALISMPPEIIVFSGSAVMNITAENAYNNMRPDKELTGSVEVTIPLMLRANNLQFTDTTDNFLADVFSDGGDLNWTDFELFRIDFDIKNGFPMGVSLQMNLCDSISHEIISTIQSPDIMEPAQVDSNGKVAGVAASKASLTFTNEFFNSIDRSDKIIFRFTMNTSENGAKDVRIYSDYRLEFKASLILKPDIKFDL